MSMECNWYLSVWYNITEDNSQIMAEENTLHGEKSAVTESQSSAVPVRQKQGHPAENEKSARYSESHGHSYVVD